MYRLGILFIFTLIILTSYTSVLANEECVCNNTSTNNFSSHEHVFTGSVQKVLVRGETENAAYLVKDNSYKGYQNEEIEIITAGSNNECRTKFIKDKNYLVYAKVNKEGKLYTDYCSGTKELGEKDNPDMQVREEMQLARSERDYTQETRDITQILESPAIPIAIVIMSSTALIGLGVIL